MAVRQPLLVIGVPPCAIAYSMILHDCAQWCYSKVLFDGVATSGDARRVRFALGIAWLAACNIV